MNSGPPKIPPQQIPGQTPPAKPMPNVILTKLPADLADTQKTVEIKGQVIRDNRDGTLQIHTERGDIEVRVDPKQLNVREGDSIEIEIPPGRPPQNARVTREPPPQTPPTQTTQTQAPPRTTQTPVNVEIRPEAPLLPATVPVTLSEGQIVRLQPITPEQVQQYAAIPLETIVAALPALTEFSAQITAQNALSESENFFVAQTNPLPQPSLNNPATLATQFFQPSTPSAIPPQAIFVNQTQPVPLPGFVPAPETIPGLTQPAAPITASLPNIGETFPPVPAPVLGAPAQMEIATLDPNATSPALVTPKILPSLFVPTESLMQTIEQPLILQNQKAPEIPAIIIGATPQKLPVIGMISPQNGEEFFFIMHMPMGNVVPGTQITLIPQEALANTATTIMAQVSFPPLPAYFLTPEPWPLMQDIEQSLIQILPQAAQGFSNMMPSPNNPAQLGPAALFFVAAVRGGDLSQWLGGSAVDALRRGGKSNLLSRLTQESSALNKLASEPVSQDWRGMALPMVFDNQIHKIALYYKNDSQSENENPEGRQMRFIFDLSLDAMGKVQLDGLFRNKRLDLIVRTLQPFSIPVQEEMKRIYAGALSETQIVGELSFQNKPEQWVIITPEGRNLGVSI